VFGHDSLVFRQFMPFGNHEAELLVTSISGVNKLQRSKAMPGPRDYKAVDIFRSARRRSPLTPGGTSPAKRFESWS
jgi:hypothetical protein